MCPGLCLSCRECSVAGDGSVGPVLRLSSTASMFMRTFASRGSDKRTARGFSSVNRLGWWRIVIWCVSILFVLNNVNCFLSWL